MQELQITKKDVDPKVKVTLYLKGTAWESIRSEAQKNNISASRLLELVFEKWMKAVSQPIPIIRT